MNAILITGAAQGIGLATAKRFAARGWFVGLYDVNAEALEQLLASGEFPNACGQACDVTDRDSIARALQQFADASGGRLDILVNNAGVLSSGRFEELEPIAHQRMIDVNVRGLTDMAQLAFPLLRDTPGSVLVNLCSASSIHGIPLLAVYGATKFYVDGLTEALHIEWAEHDIRVTAIKPPVIDTAMGHQLNPQLTAKMGIGMEADDVAAAIEKAANGRSTSHVLGFTTKLWALVDKLMPGTVRHAIARYLTGH